MSRKDPHKNQSDREAQGGIGEIRSEPHGSEPHGSEPHGSEPHGSEPHGSEHSNARFRIAVCAVIERDGQYLLAHRSDIPWWNLVGGGLEYGETLEEGLAREVREEVGAQIEVVRLVGVYSKPQKREVVFTFFCHLASGSPEPRASEEVARVAWFLPQHLPANLLPKHAERLQDALLGQAAAVVRAQTTSTAQDQGLDQRPDQELEPGIDRG